MLEILVIVVIAVVYSRKLLDLSLSLLVTSSTIMVSLISLSICVLILSIAAIPAIVIGCKVAERHYGKARLPENVALVCGEPSRTQKVVSPQSVELYRPSPPSNSAPGKY